MMANSKKCFVIAPIGEENSETRKRSDQILEHIIKPAVVECGFNDNEIQRADHISEPGIITTQVIERLINDDLVVADLTNHNPNVFYELAVRHAIRKPIVQMIHMGEKIPFDVAASRTITFDHHDLDSVACAKKQMVKQINAAMVKPDDVDTPLSTAIDIQTMRGSSNPLEKSYAEIIEMLQGIGNAISDADYTPPLPKGLHHYLSVLIL